MKNIVLTGFMGTGKTTVGRLLAMDQGLKFIDIDDVIEKEEGLSIAEIFEAKGEGHFRAVESSVVKGLAQARFGNGIVVSAGGGAVLNDENRRLLKGIGPLVCLSATIDEILKRTEASLQRPLLSKKDKREAIERLLNQRQGAYRDCDLMVQTTGKTPSMVVDEIKGFLGKDTVGKGDMRTINVSLGARSYDIKVGRGIIDCIGAGLKALGFSGNAAVITNPVVYGLYGERLVKGLEGAGFKTLLITVPDGEDHKNLKEASNIYDSLIGQRFERGFPIIALGGGVIGDLAGFVAATYLRGVPFIQVPTTLLADVDSSVGGKTGVNHEKGKNLIGAFYQPRGVFIDPDALSTLPKRELSAGMAEVVKYGVIWDKAFFGFIEEKITEIMGLKQEAIHAIERSCEIKALIVAKDEYEAGLRAILNFGHTFGHAIENLSGYGSLRHGEAVAIGMVYASELSEHLGLAKTGLSKRIKDLLSAIGLPTESKAIEPQAFIQSMQLDKKVQRQKMRFVLAEDIGKVSIREVSPHELTDFFKKRGRPR
jgi:3-dehydroquinate synthase